jgi:glyoxylase-like metal-dependent hydrolase (beta-lactamase superfamily II)
MKTFLSRREFVTSLSGTTLAGTVLAGAWAGGMTLRSATAAAREARASLSGERLGDGLLLIHGAGANVVALRDDAGLVFVDGGLKTHASALLSLAQRELGARQAHALINTHWHPEHTGLNELLGKQGARIIAHENTRLWLSTTVRYEPDGPPIGPLPAVGRPNATTYTTGELKAGDETLRYGYLSQAHTDGDLYVKLVKANVLITGGVVAGNGWPTMDWVTGGWINGTVNGYRTLIAQCDDKTRVVTANGDRLFTKADLQAELDILAKLADQLGKMMRAGYAPADMLAANPAKDYVARMGEPTAFLTASFKSLWPRLAPDA